ncbi:hypothetical protein HZC21_02455 [Candidatus Peregrinibacteria bacterium]|nr:hypothetical protein [Candidatus Peregrinibacteria bacterium]
MDISEEKFETVRKRAEEEYVRIGTVRCPYLQDEVHFNRVGFEHLLFKEWNKTRSRIEQYVRLKLLKLAPLVLSKSHTLQEYDERRMFVRQKINTRWESRVKLVRYYVFVAIINDARIKIIVKEIEGGSKIFYSLYPSWKVVVDVNGEKKKRFFTGDPETD